MNGGGSRYKQRRGGVDVLKKRREDASALPKLRKMNNHVSKFSHEVLWSAMRLRIALGRLAKGANDE
jgi:hypothetical protein